MFVCIGELFVECVLLLIVMVLLCVLAAHVFSQCICVLFVVNLLV